MTRILFVCLGNICRSPTAEGVMRALVREAGLEDEIEIDSAGTGGWHVGAAPDPRSTAAAARRGITLEGGARQVTDEDFEHYDLILAMDRENLRELQRRAPAGTAGKIRLLCGEADVPDPYYGGERGFDDVLDQVEAACRAVLAEIR